MTAILEHRSTFHKKTCLTAFSRWLLQINRAVKKATKKSPNVGLYHDTHNITSADHFKRHIMQQVREPLTKGGSLQPEE